MPGSRQELFRKAALDRLSAPQELDALMAVTQPRAWLALIATGILLVIGLLWAVFGRLHATVEGSGVFVREQVFHIAALQSGQLIDVKVAGGSRVRAGEVVAVARAIPPAPDDPGGGIDIVAPRAGRILEVLAKPGDVLTPGRSIATLELDGEMEAIVYVDAADSRRIRPDMAVQILPATYDKAEFGYVRGHVRSIGAVPASRDAMRAVLEDDQVIDRLTRGRPVVPVYVQLSSDARTPSGLSWSSSQGPPSAMHSGTTCTAMVIIDERPPITLVFPALQGRLAR